MGTMQRYIWILSVSILMIASLAVLDFVRAKMEANERATSGNYSELHQTSAEPSAVGGSEEQILPALVRPTSSNGQEPGDWRDR